VPGEPTTHSFYGILMNCKVLIDVLSACANSGPRGSFSALKGCHESLTLYIELRETMIWWLKPVSLVILVLSFNHVECINKPALGARVFLALMK